MKNSKIEWCHHTVNFWWGCTKVSPGCAACYALAMARIWRKNDVTWGPGGKRGLRQNKALSELLKLDISAEKRGVRERVFINSMSDTFEDHPALEAGRAALWLAVYGVRNLDLLLLTKRPENVMRMVPAHWRTNWPANVWIGTTVEDQQRAVERIPQLLSIPAKVRFLSCEPLLGEVIIPHATDPNDDQKLSYLEGIHWVICGGESSSKARPMHPDWARSLRDQCKRADVPFFFKQWGEWMPIDQCIHRLGPEWSATGAAKIERGIYVHDFPDGIKSGRFGKEIGGRLLDGVEHNQFPAPPTVKPARDVCTEAAQTPRFPLRSAKTPRRAATPSREIKRSKP